MGNLYLVRSAFILKVFLGLTIMGLILSMFILSSTDAHAADVSTGLELYYPLNTNKGSDAWDNSGNKRHGKLINMTVEDWISGKQGNALDFDGVNDFVEVPDQVAFRDLPITISAFVKLDTLPKVSGIPAMIARERVGSKPWYAWSFYVGRNDNKLRFSSHNGSNSTYIISDEPLSKNTWYHVAVTVDVERNMRLYVNGVPQARKVKTSGFAQNTVNLRIGASSAAYNQLDGRVDDVRIYSRDLKDADIAALAAGTAPEPVSSPEPEITHKFQYGDTVVTTDTVAVRKTAAGAWVGRQVAGVTGKIVGGPAIADFNGRSFTWWQVDYGSGADGWSAQAWLEKQVDSSALPTLTFIANKTTISSGETFGIAWAAENAETCFGFGNWSGTKALSGSRLFTGVTSDKSYGLTCTNVGGSVTELVNVTVVGGATSQTKSATKKVSGHYLSIASEQNPISGDSRVKQILQKTGVEGVQLRYQWRTVEPTKGNYDFSKIRADLKTVKGLNKKLIVMVEDRSFKADHHYLPNYLADYAVPYAKEDDPNTRHGWSSQRWNPVMIERFQAMYKALAAEFDSDPNFAGVSMQETAIGSNFMGGDYGYTKQKYLDGLKQIINYGKGEFKESEFMWYFNFLKGGSTAEMLSYLSPSFYSSGVNFGGPDVTPEAPGHSKQVTPGYKWLVSTYPDGKRFCSFQFNSYKHKKPDGTFYTLSELLYDWAVDTYDCDTFLWNKNDGGKPYNTNDALEVIAAYPR